MKAPQPRHARPAGQSLLCFICLVSVLVSITLLGAMRLYGLYLDHRVAFVIKKIEAVTASNAELEERYSALLSPSRIYTFAKSELNMVTASKVETIRLAGSANSSGASYASLPDERVIVLEDEQGWASLFSFVGVANAKD